MDNQFIGELILIRQCKVGWIASCQIEKIVMTNTTQLSDDKFEALADVLADEFMKYVGPDCSPLSDYAVSREGLYEDHL